MEFGTSNLNVANEWVRLADNSSSSSRAQAARAEMELENFSRAVLDLLGTLEKGQLRVQRLLEQHLIFVDSDLDSRFALRPSCV